MKKFLTLTFILACFCTHIQAQLAVTASSTDFSIDFDSTLVGVNEGAIDGSGYTPSPASGQIDSDAFSITGFSDGDLAFGGTQLTGDYTRGVSSGGASSGGMYAFMTSGANLAVGLQPGGSDWTPGTLALKMENQTGSVIEEITISYDIYVNNDQGRANSFNFAHSADDITYTAEPTLDYTSMEASDALGFVAVPRTITITGLAIPASGSYFFQWSGDDETGSGGRDEFGLDNITVNVMTNSSVICAITDIEGINVSACDDNGTPSDASDDFFETDVLVTFADAPATGDLELFLASDTSLLASVAVASLDSATGHSFLTQQFPADGMDIGLIAKFTDDTTCMLNDAAAVTGVAACPALVIFEISQADSCFEIDFDAAVPGINDAQIDGSGFSPSPASGQVNSNSFIYKGLSDGDLNYGDDVSSGDYAKGVSTGGESSGGAYAFEVASGDRALGVQPTGSDWTPGSIDFRFMNSTGAVLDTLMISYDIYVLNNATRSNSFNFSHSADDVTYTAEPTLDFASAEAADASPAWQATNKFITLTGLNIPDGGFYYLRWEGDNVSGGGSVDEFALDNITMNAGGSCFDGSCNVFSISAINTGSCDDNSTPSDITDDFFPTDVLVTFGDAPATGNLELFLASDTSLLASVAVASLDSATGHTFLTQQFPANGMNIGLIAVFSDDTTCMLNDPNAVMGVEACPPVIIFEISQTDSCFEINFDSPAVGVNSAQYDGSGFAPLPAGGQINSNTFIYKGLSDGDLNYGDDVSSGDYAKGVSTGGESSGGAYAFEVAPSDRALGVQPTSSDWTPGSIDMRFVNTTGAVLDTLTISYDIYVLNNATRSNSFNFSHSADDVTYTPEPTLDFASTEAPDPSPIWVATNRMITLTGLNIPDAGIYYLRWESDNATGSGSVDEFALDNIIMNSGGSCVDTTCNLVLVEADSIYVCNDGGTPNDISDDSFAADILVEFVNAPSTGTLDVYVGTEATPTMSVPVAMLDSNDSHVFDSVIFAITGSAYSLTAVFSDDTDCILTNPSGVAAVAPCSTTPCAMPGDLVITEYMVNPNDIGDESGEYFELYNRSDDTFNLFTYFINDLGTQSFTIDRNLIIYPGEFLVFGNSDTLGSLVDFVYGNSMALANTTDDINLRCPDSSIVVSLSYNDGNVFGSGVAAELLCVDLPGFIFTENDFVAATNPLNYDADANEDSGSPGTFGNTIFTTGPAELILVENAPEVAGGGVTFSISLCATDVDSVSPCGYDDFIVLNQVSGPMATIAVDSVMAENGCAIFNITMPMITTCDTVKFVGSTDTLQSDTFSIFVKEVVHFEPFICNALTWSVENVDGQQTWECDTINEYVSINTFGDTGTTSEDWLISPALGLSAYTDLSLSFETRERFGGPALELLYSEDYSGTGDPNLATWVALTFNFDNSQNGFAFGPWTASGDIDLPSTASFVAFKYTGLPSTSEWLVNDVVISGCPKISGALVVNEIWNDQSFSSPTCFTHKSFIELIVTAKLDDSTATTANLQNWIVEPSTVENGHLRIKSGCLTDVPIGSVIVIYNSENIPVGISGPDEMDADSDLVYYIPSNSTCLEYTSEAGYPGTTYTSGDAPGCLHSEQISAVFSSLPYTVETRSSVDASVFDALEFSIAGATPVGATGLDCGNITDPANELSEITTTPGEGNTVKNGLIISAIQDEAGNGSSAMPDSAAINYVNYLTPGLTPDCGEVIFLSCVDTLLIVGPVMVSDTSSAALWIETDGSVVVNTSAVFDAPEILLNGGFEVPLGAEFITILTGCDLTSSRDASNANGSTKVLDAKAIKENNGIEK